MCIINVHHKSIHTSPDFDWWENISQSLEQGAKRSKNEHRILMNPEPIAHQRDPRMNMKYLMDPGPIAHQRDPRMNIEYLMNPGPTWH